MRILAGGRVCCSSDSASRIAYLSASRIAYLKVKSPALRTIDYRDSAARSRSPRRARPPRPGEHDLADAVAPDEVRRASAQGEAMTKR